MPWPSHASLCRGWAFVTRSYSGNASRELVTLVMPARSNSTASAPGMAVSADRRRSRASRRAAGLLLSATAVRPAIVDGDVVLR